MRINVSPWSTEIKKHFWPINIFYPVRNQILKLIDQGTDKIPYIIMIDWSTSNNGMQYTYPILETDVLRI